jgi:hypothetical protein
LKNNALISHANSPLSSADGQTPPWSYQLKFISTGVSPGLMRYLEALCRLPASPSPIRPLFKGRDNAKRQVRDRIIFFKKPKGRTKRKHHSGPKAQNPPRARGLVLYALNHRMLSLVHGINAVARSNQSSHAPDTRIRATAHRSKN